jgi:hypothetical protein
MMRDLRCADFLRSLPDILTTPTDDNATKVIDYVINDLHGQSLAQRQLLSLARRLYPLESRGFHILDQFYTSSSTLERLSLNETRAAGYAVRPLEAIATTARRDWYLSDLAFQFYATWYEGYHFDELSFQIVDARGQLLLTVPCTIFRDSPMTYFNQPIVFIAEPALIQSSTIGERKKVVALAMRQLESLATEYLSYSFLATAENDELEEALYSVVSDRRNFITVRSQPIVALDATDDELFRSIRRRYKTLVSASRKSYETSYYSGDLLERESEWIRQCFLSLSADTYILPANELDFCLQLCCSGRGEVQIARGRDGNVAGAQIVADDGLTTIYAIGAYGKSEQKLPVSHGMMFNSMIRAKNRGMKSFFLSHIPDPRYDFNGFGVIDAGADRDGYKFFKLGFANKMRRWTSFRIMPDEQRDIHMAGDS